MAAPAAPADRVASEVSAFSTEVLAAPAAPEATLDPLVGPAAPLEPPVSVVSVVPVDSAD
jgi:hypothetical protein